MTIEEAKELLLNISAYDIDMQRGMAKQEAIEMAIKALEQEPCEDAISREWLKTAIHNFYYGLKHTPTEEDIQAYIDAAPSVSTENTGHWIEQDGYDGDTYYDCSECGESFCLIDGTPTDNLYNYCPNCGAKMEAENG